MKDNKHPTCKTISIGLIGPGLIGSTLLQQIHRVTKAPNANAQVNLHVHGIMKSKLMLLSHHPIDLTSWETQFNQYNTAASLNAFIEHMLLNTENPVIIDCTASEDISRQYLNILAKEIHVITPNKHANAGDLDYYKQIKQQTISGNARYFYEATVGAGLPFITTLQDMMKTGDRVLKIEGIISGTLNYIFRELATNRSFSDVVIEAKHIGVTEPDPREDLSGMDVARKLVCLAREIGHETTLDDINVHNLVPDALKSCTIDKFLEQLPCYDDQMQPIVTKAKTNNERLCYVGSIDSHGTVDVTIKTFPQNHPFARLHKKDNMLIIHTERYHDNPLIIQGPVAGAELTAAGIFADLWRLV